MKRIVYVVVAVVALVGVGALGRYVVWPYLRPKNPVAVLIQGLQSTDSQTRLKSANKLAAFQGEGTEAAIEPLTELLAKEPNEDVQRAAALALVKLQGADAAAAVPVLIKGVKQPEVAVRKECAVALGEIGSSAAAAIAPLTGLLENPDRELQRVAAAALVKIQGAEAVAAIPVLIEALKDPDDQIREEFAYHLGQIGPKAAEAAKPLTRLLKDANPKVRLASAIALVQIQGTKAAAAFSALLNALKDEDAQTRQDVAKVLGDLGPEATAAVPDLTALLKDKNRDVQRAAAVALAWIQEAEAVAVVPVLIRAVRTQDVQILQDCAAALGQIGPPAKDAAGRLNKLLENPEAAVQLAAARALVKIQGVEAKAAIPILTANLSNEDPKVRKELAETLGSFGAGAAEAVEGLTGLLKDPEEETQWAAAAALVYIQGEEATAAFPVLKKGLKADEDETRAQCAGALGYLGKNATAAVESLEKLLEDKNPQVKRAAAGSLARIQKGEANKAVVPILMEGLAQEDPSARQDCIQALAELGPAGTGAGEALSKLLDDKVPETKRAAAVALAKIQGPKAVNALPVLLAGLNEKDADTRIQCAQALARLGPEAKQAVESLTQLLKDEDESVRKEAGEALKKIQPK